MPCRCFKKINIKIWKSIIPRMLWNNEGKNNRTFVPFHLPHCVSAPCMLATTKLTTEFLPCFCQSWLITLQRSRDCKGSERVSRFHGSLLINYWANMQLRRRGIISHSATTMMMGCWRWCSDKKIFINLTWNLVIRHIHYIRRIINCSNMMKTSFLYFNNYYCYLSRFNF